MDFCIDNIPTLHSETSTIDGPIYNRIRLGLLHTEGALRLPLVGLRGMDIVLNRKRWVCIDRAFYDLPVLAWANFEPSERRSLQDPVACKIHYYHVHADFIVHTVLRAAINALRARAHKGDFAETYPIGSQRVISLSSRLADSGT
ncbi:MAG: hypothetical protein LBV36_00850 [Chromatiales bacterium]|jgi:hypothetical protein|nr:hypothetical protein [Chromatiales bacterium]